MSVLWVIVDGGWLTSAPVNGLLCVPSGARTELLLVSECNRTGRAGLAKTEEVIIRKANCLLIQ